MRKSIFDVELRVNIKYEYEVLKQILSESGAICYKGCFYSLYDFLNDEIFPIWKYKGMFIDLDDFCYRLDIDLRYQCTSKEKFLYLLELLINLWTVCELEISEDEKDDCSKKVLGYMRKNLPLIIEKMNYKIFDDDDKFKIVKRDSDVDSILDLVSSDCAKLLLDYNDIRNNTLKNKKSILKELDLYLEKNKKDFLNVDNETYTTIQYIVNNMGVNHPIKKEIFKIYSEEELIDWYDKCFKLIIHFIRKKEVNEINKVRKEFDKD